MITFTPLAGDAKGTRTAPLSYLLQIDDVHILLDCGSPDWNPEKSASTSAVTADELVSREEYWESYCDSLKKCVSHAMHEHEFLF
jgi:cleavage and polyadenylation specificity factor subunit 2